MLVVQLTIISLVFIGLMISNVLTIVLVVLFILEDEPSDLQGADYIIASMAISDLFLAIFCVPFSLASHSMGQSTVSTGVCEFCAYLGFTLWLFHIYTFLYMSTDRRLYITDKKYRQYSIRTRRRCICEIILAGTVAFLFSFATTSFVSDLETTLLNHQICTINWSKATCYLYTVIITSVVPSTICSTFNFIQIFCWRIQWKTGRTKTKLNGATVLALLDSTHIVCAAMYLVFWSSWIPFCFDLYRVSSGWRSLNSVSSLYFWLGCSQGIWKFPIMITFCRKYRDRFCSLCTVRAVNDLKPATTNQNVCDIETSLSGSSQQHLTEDTELHL